MVAAAVALRDSSDPAYALILALVGLAFIGMAYARRREKPRATRVAIGSLATLAVLLTCGLVAALAPARRAARIDPIKAVRQE